MLRFAIFLAISSLTVSVLTVPLNAQWIHLRTPGIPRTADGRPNLNAPAPKTADGHPDFSGLWIPKAELPCDVKSRGVQCTELPLTPQVLNIAQGLKGGLPYQPWATKLMKDRAKDVPYIDPHVHCMPPNYPRAWSFPETQKIIQTPTELVLLHEFNATYRQIFMDGRKLPDDMLPSWNGYSVARWAGDTLVVDSAGYRDDSWLDTTGNFFSSNAQVNERIHRPKFGELDVDLTVNDSKVFTGPWTVHFQLRPLLDTAMIDFWCQDNNTDVKHFVK